MDPGIPFADLLAYNSAETLTGNAGSPSRRPRSIFLVTSPAQEPCGICCCTSSQPNSSSPIACSTCPRRTTQTLPRAASDLSASAGIQAGLDARLNRQQSHGLSSLQLQRLQVVAECLTQFFPLQRHLNGSFQESELVAGIVAAPFVDIGINALLFEQRL